MKTSELFSVIIEEEQSREVLKIDKMFKIMFRNGIKDFKIDVRNVRVEDMENVKQAGEGWGCYVIDTELHNGNKDVFIRLGTYDMVYKK